MLTVIVTDPEQRAALATARALGRRGMAVHTVGSSRGLAGHSRMVRAHHVVREEDLVRADTLVSRVAEVVGNTGADVIVPVSDRASRALLGHDALVGTRVAGPSRQAYLRASDKDGVLRAAAQCGLRIPCQQVLATAAQPVPATWPGAMVVKPSCSVVTIGGRATTLGVRFVETANALPAVVTRYPAEAYPLLLQERIIGPGIGVFLLRDAGRTLLSFAHRRLREKPPAGGVSTYREAILPPPELVARCERLLDLLAYEGAAMIEFKQHAITGEYVLMEINARLWGSVQLAIDAGVDFPSALVRSALGLPPEPAAPPQVGMRTVWELGELDHALAMATGSPATLQVPDGTATGLRAAVAALFDHRRSDRPEVFRLNDPLPFVAELARWVARR